GAVPRPDRTGPPGGSVRDVEARLGRRGDRAGARGQEVVASVAAQSAAPVPQADAAVRAGRDPLERAVPAEVGSPAWTPKRPGRWPARGRRRTPPTGTW